MRTASHPHTHLVRPSRSSRRPSNSLSTKRRTSPIPGYNSPRCGYQPIGISFFSPILSPVNIPRAQHMATELSLILDDNSGRFTYSGGRWTLSTLVQWYKGTSWYPGFAGSGSDFGSFTMSFEGTSSLILCKGLTSTYFTFRLRGIGRFHWQYPCAKPFSKRDSFH